MSLLSLPSDPGNLSDSGEPNGPEIRPPKYPHTRAQLSALARQFKPVDSFDSDIEGDDIPRVSSSFVNRVVAMLVDEREDDLQALLTDAFGMDHETVRCCRAALAGYALTASIGRAERAGSHAQTPGRSRRRALLVSDTDSPTHLAPVLEGLCSSIPGQARYSQFRPQLAAVACLPPPAYPARVAARRRPAVVVHVHAQWQ